MTKMETFMENDFKKIHIPLSETQTSSVNNPNKIKVTINEPKPVGWLVISRDKETNFGVKLALYNKLPSKFKQFFIKLFFGWWVEEETEQTQT